MDNIKLLDQNYIIVEDYNDAIEMDKLVSLFTDYFLDFDKIVGDWSYGSLRLKGFCNKKNRRYRKLNDESLINDYLKESCSYGCRYFVLKKGDEND